MLQPAEMRQRRTATTRASFRMAQIVAKKFFSSSVVQFFSRSVLQFIGFSASQLELGATKSGLLKD
jgi:hypothetical protein